MFINAQELNAVSLKHLEALTAATASTTRGLLVISTEATVYSKKCIENTQTLGEKLLHARFDEIIQLQSDFAKTAFDGFISEASKIGDIYSDLAKEAFNSTKVALSPQSSGGSSSSASKQSPTQKLDAIAA